MAARVAFSAQGRIANILEGDKQMLMDNLKRKVQEIYGWAEGTPGEAKLDITQPAANTGTFVKPVSGRRRLRRQVLATRRANHGWSVRAW
jgi:hypothetical protein